MWFTFIKRFIKSMQRKKNIEINWQIFALMKQLLN